MDTVFTNFYKNKFKIWALTWNGEFELPNCHVFKTNLFISWKLETLTDDTPIQIYVNRIGNRVITLRLGIIFNFNTWNNEIKKKKTKDENSEKVLHLEMQK